MISYFEYRLFGNFLDLIDDIRCDVRYQQLDQENRIRL